jgi:uncharacterized membrane protein YvlD (DUF360 family)
MRRIVWHWIISAFALWLTVTALSGHIVMANPWSVLWIAPLLGLVNFGVGIITWVISLLAFPITVLTLGCFGFVISFILYTVAILALFGPGKGLADAMTVENFFWAMVLSAVMALFSSVLNMLLPGKDRKRD